MSQNEFKRILFHKTWNYTDGGVISKHKNWWGRYVTYSWFLCIKLIWKISSDKLKAFLCSFGFQKHRVESQKEILFQSLCFHSIWSCIRTKVLGAILWESSISLFERSSKGLKISDQRLLQLNMYSYIFHYFWPTKS